jgi:hypothetical protein
MASYTHDNLKVVGVHRPDYSMEAGPDGNRMRVDLPGDYVIGVEIDGAFVPVTTIKKSTLDTMVEQAQLQQQQQTGPTSETQTQ